MQVKTPLPHFRMSGLQSQLHSQFQLPAELGGSRTGIHASHVGGWDCSSSQLRPALASGTANIWRVDQRMGDLSASNTTKNKNQMIILFIIEKLEYSEAQDDND